MESVNLESNASGPYQQSVSQVATFQLRESRLAAKISHVYVEAYVPYGNYRGTGRDNSAKTWIPLDASYKQYTYTQGLDIKSAIPFDAQIFVNQIQSTATIDTVNNSVTNVNSLYVQQQMQDYQARVQNYISQNYPNATVGDILGKKEIIKKEYPYLIGSLLYKLIAEDTKYADVPDNLRHKITFSVMKDMFDADSGTAINVTKSLSEIAGKRISLNYVPATDADKNIIDSYVQNNAASLPAYLINLKAELKIEGTVIALGPFITMGTGQTFNITFSDPTISETETHQIKAGDYNVIGFNIGGAKPIFEQRINRGDFSDAVSEMLHQTILGYWAEYDTLKNVYAETYRIGSVRLPSEGLSSAPVNIRYLFGVPHSGSYSSKGLDIKRDTGIAQSLYGDIEKAKGFNQATGIVGSYFEGVVFDQLFGYEIGNGISAVRIMEITNSQGIPIYHINGRNMNAVLPNLQLSDTVIGDVRNALNAGKEVTVPGANITHNGWTGTGYIVRDSVTGSGAYMIDGGTAGSVYKYEASMDAAMVMGEAPYTPAITSASNSWTQRVGSAALSEIAADLSIDIPELIITAASALIALTVLMLIVIIAAAIDQIVDAVRVSPLYKRFRHYTTVRGKTAILTSPVKIILLSETGDLGPGAYVTDFFMEPDSGGPNSITIGEAINKHDYTSIQTYVELMIDINRIVLLNGALVNPAWKWQWVYPNRSLLIDGRRVYLLGTMN